MAYLDFVEDGTLLLLDTKTVMLCLELVDVQDLTVEAARTGMEAESS